MKADKFEQHNPGGFNVVIGHVNLSDGNIWYESPSYTWYRRYGGGGSLAAYYILRQMPILCDALSPENIIIFASSIVGGLDAPALSKHSVVAKSPLTGCIGESQSVSTFGPAFKSSGLDALVIYGKSNKPSYILIKNSRIFLKDASEIWGKDVAESHDFLLSAEGKNIHTAIIGIAGEKLVRFASIVNDVNFMCCRTGLGAVMGSKNLKAVVVFPGEQPKFSDPDTANEAIEDYWKNRRNCIVNKAQEDAGIASWLADTPGSATWPIVSRNFQRSYFPAIGKISGQRLENEYKINMQTPKNIEYYRRYRVVNGKYKTDERYGGLEVNSVASLGPMLWIDNLEPILKLSEFTYKYGLDPESLGGTLAWAMECFEKNLYSKSNFDNLEIQFGDADAALYLTECIAKREGIGDLLAEGSQRASIKLSKGSEKFLMTCKGKEIPPHEPRNKVGLALAYGVGPIGPDYCVIEHDFDYSPNGFDHILDNSRAYGMLERTPETVLDGKKVRQVVYLHRWWSGALESLLFDLFGIAPARYMPPTRVEQLIRGITGWDFSIYEIMLIGERRIAMFQVFNRKAGFTKKDDFLPERFYKEPLPEGLYKGAVLDYDKYNEAIDLYYAMNNWDANGFPTKQKLYELELDWLID